MNEILLILVLFVPLFFFSTHSSPFPGAVDEVRSLPNLKTQPNFRHYAGYLNASPGRFPFYWFLESQSQPQSDPLVQWLAGGPGDSSVESMFFGLGPWRATDGGRKLIDSNMSWNRFANTLFIDSPIGVGYSYETDSNYTHDDSTTTEDMFLALKSFFVKFPQYASNKFYLTGVSYGGVYIPHLASKIIRNNEINSHTKINLKGVAIGNGLINGAERHAITDLHYEHRRGLIDSGIWNKLNEVCGCPKLQNISSFCNFFANMNQPCRDVLAEIFAEKYVLSYVYVKETYKVKYDYMKAWNSTPPLIWAYNTGKPKPPICNDTKTQLNHYNQVNDCIDYYSFLNYMSDNSVKKRLHATSEFAEFNLTTDCFWNYQKGCAYKVTKKSMLSLFKEMIQSKQLDQIILYFGDWDMTCDYISGEWFLDRLGVTEINGYKKWIFNNEIVGFTKKFVGNLTFVQVREAGHMVQVDRPEVMEQITKHLIGQIKIV